MLLAWAYSRQIAGSDALADVGAVSFSALATLVPALAFAVWRPQTPARAATVGIVVAFAVWAWVMLVPMWMAATGGDTDWLQRGPLGMAWLSPEDRKSVVEGKSVSGGLDLGGRRIIKKKKKQ